MARKEARERQRSKCQRELWYDTKHINTLKSTQTIVLFCGLARQYVAIK